MRSRTFWLCVFTGLFLVGLASTDAAARERKRSGEYTGKRTSGTFERKVDRKPGQVTKDTTWQNERGQGSRHSERQWDRESRTGSYSSSTTRPGGAMTSRSGVIRQNEDGSFSQQGTITGPKGRTTQVDREIVKQEDGSRSHQTTYTGPNDQTLTIDKNVSRTDQGRQTTGSYSSSTGRSGTFQSVSTRSGGKITTHRSLTNQDQRTWQRHIETDRTGNTVTRNVTTTNPEGVEKTFQQSVTFDDGSVE